MSNYLHLRAAADRVVAASLLVIVSPILAIVSLAILVRMGRPVFFRQDRVGQHGRVFKILKFRTMVANAAQLGGGYMPPELDLIPPLGRFLRRTSLDEIPQLVNILRGEMSFVGPRPALEEQYVRYTPEQAKRVLVPQGVTGLAQVTYRNNAPWSRRIEADVQYVNSVGIILDMRILLSTIGRVARSEGVIHDQTSAEVDDLAAPKDLEKDK